MSSKGSATASFSIPRLWLLTGGASLAFLTALVLWRRHRASLEAAAAAAADPTPMLLRPPRSPAAAPTPVPAPAAAAAAAPAAVSAPEPAPVAASTRPVSPLDPLLANLERQFGMSPDELEHFASAFHADMLEGLNSSLSDSKSDIRQLPSHVSHLPAGNERGTFYAIDLGGTNLRVVAFELRGPDGAHQMGSERFRISDAIMGGTAADLFGFIADSVASTLAKYPPKELASGASVPIGFTFSFPVDQSSINSGSLITWTKSFRTSGVVGHDVVALLQEQLRMRCPVPTQVVALVNDTVGTLMANAYEHKDTLIGVILGTGCNACYVEDVHRIGKWRGPRPSSGKMIINMECGNFDSSKRRALKYTEFDRELDQNTPNVGAQALEKMQSGLYLGELARLALVSLMRAGVLFSGESSLASFPRWSLQTQLLSEVLLNESTAPDSTYPVTERVLTSELQLHGSSVADRAAFFRVCQMVVRRAATLSAAYCATIIRHLGAAQAGRTVTIAIDGSVFENLLPIFRPMQMETLRLMLGDDGASRVSIMLSKDGSGKGAAIIASVASLDAAS